MEYLKNQEEIEAIHWFEEAAKVAEKAMCHKVKCGTVIIRDGKIIGSGYNAPPLDSEENRHCDDEPNPGKPLYDKTCCIHAEWRAIHDAIKNFPDKLSGARLYFSRVNTEGIIKRSGKPYCTTCSRLALDAGVGKFLLWHEEGVCEYSTAEYDKVSYEYTE